MKPRLIVGIDPGVHTGFAIWSLEHEAFTDVRTLGITEAMTRVRLMCNAGSLHSVIFEDARLRKWFGAKGKEALQGAGSIKRDSSIWEEFLIGLESIPFLPVSPEGKGVKYDAKAFQRITGWTGRTSEHARDAAMLVFGIKA
jgi:hypothetical protein